MSDQHKRDIFGYKSKRHSYFDDPDGEEIFKKWLIFMKPALATSAMVSSLDILTSRKSLTYGQMFKPMAHISTPFVGSETAFVLVTNLVAQRRGGGVKTSWFLGGASAGLVFGAWWGAGVATVSSGFVCLVRKDLLERGWNLIPEKKLHAYGSMFAFRQDWTLIWLKHIPGDYKTTIEPEVEDVSN